MIGQMIEDGLVDGAALLDDLLSSTPIGGAMGGGGDTGGTGATGGTGSTGAPDEPGLLEGGAEQFVAAVPLEMAEPVGQMIEDGIVDGAAAMLIGSEAAAKAHGFTPRARIVSVALSGADPTIMLTGPMPAARKALAKAGLSIDQIDLFEVNEAFAAVPMKFMQELGVPHEKVNVNGGAIALGHPLGATGAMILNALVDELHRTGKRYGLATLCVGGGMGIATIVERV